MSQAAAQLIVTYLASAFLEMPLSLTPQCSVILLGPETPRDPLSLETHCSVTSHAAAVVLWFSLILRPLMALRPHCSWETTALWDPPPLGTPCP